MKPVNTNILIYVNDPRDPIKQKNIIKFLYKIVFWMYSILRLYHDFLFTKWRT
jgi:hypothetical protein